MPVIEVPRKTLFPVLGENYTEKEFEDLCFEFGIELDDVTSEKMIREQKGLDSRGASEEIIYKVEIPANRYDLLCYGGLLMALMSYLGKEKYPVFQLSKPLLSVKVSKEVENVRKIVRCAILRNVTFTKDTYDSFIQFQEKLHIGICCNRSLASIGTHDLDKIEPPFIYTAEEPSEIKFVPLGQTDLVDGHGVMDMYETHSQLKKFLPIIRDKSKYPVFRDNRGRVLSLPPIINSEYSKITLDTKNVFIEVTGLDETKCEVTLDMVAILFSQHSSTPYIIEPVILECADGSKKVFPEWPVRKFRCPVGDINGTIGVNLNTEQISNYLIRMGLIPLQVSDDKSEIVVEVPRIRSDILHNCDIIEDIAIAYGYNNLELQNPPTLCEGKPLAVNKLSDALRSEIAQQGYLEIVSFILTSIDDNYKKMNLTFDGEAVELSNPKGNVQICRTNLISGLLKSLESNKSTALPMKIFEVGDIVVRDNKCEIGASNARHLAAAIQIGKSGFELIHGLLDHIMNSLECHPKGKNPSSKFEYQISEVDHPSFFPGRCAKIEVNQKVIGKFGILHPNVLDSFHLKNPTSVMEINIEQFI